MLGEQGMIAVDWGTSAFRAYRVGADGRVLDQVETADGILTAGQRGFADVLNAALAPWLVEREPGPILMSGMIGSRQGWAEVSYLDCPATASTIAAALHRLEGPGLDQVYIVPGLTTHDADGLPDVMRGEETQIIGAMAATGRRSGVFVLPGTHSKWVEIADGSILGFATFMTGEVYAALKSHTILGRLMTDATPDSEGFARGVATAALGRGGPGSLLHMIFSARSLALFGQLASDQVAGYLSGLLIGAELKAAAPAGGELTIIAAPELAALYAAAASQLGLVARTAPANCVAAGHFAIGVAARLLKDPDHARP